MIYTYIPDTDSLHICLPNGKELKEFENELKQFVDIDDYRLGAFKIESCFKRGKYLRQKCYIEENEDKINVTVAGLPKNLGKYINFENFNQGLLLSIDNQDIDHKLTFKHVKGGVLLVDTDFTIK